MAMQLKYVINAKLKIKNKTIEFQMYNMVIKIVYWGSSQ